MADQYWYTRFAPRDGVRFAKKGRRARYSFLAIDTDGKTVRRYHKEASNLPPTNAATSLQLFKSLVNNP